MREHHRRLTQSQRKLLMQYLKNKHKKRKRIDLSGYLRNSRVLKTWLLPIVNLKRNWEQGLTNKNKNNHKAMNNKRTTLQKIRILILLLLKLVRSSLRMTVLYLKRPIRILLRLGYRRS
uniref:Scaffolding protein n=1 Tax=uncultured marine virus TaxID=186617 RepID=A0A0F7LC85_9VIRU|nr:scaffolding protein [uncultured marine virus]